MPRAAGRPRDATRESAILAAAVEVLAEVGYDRLSVEAVAVRASASKATIYRRFSGKADLVVAALQCRPVSAPCFADTGDLRADLIEGLLGVVDDISGPELDVLAGVIAAMRTDPQLAALVRHQMVSCRHDAGMAWLERYVERGQVRSDADVGLVGETVAAVLFQRLLVTGDPVDRAFVERLVDTVMVPLIASVDYQLHRC